MRGAASPAANASPSDNTGTNDSPAEEENHAARGLQVLDERVPHERPQFIGAPHRGKALGEFAHRLLEREPLLEEHPIHLRPQPALGEDHHGGEHERDAGAADRGIESMCAAIDAVSRGTSANPPPTTTTPSTL